MKEIKKLFGPTTNESRLVSKETVVPLRRGRETRKFVSKRINEGQIT